jgi:hypothetical protein
MEIEIEIEIAQKQNRTQKVQRNFKTKNIYMNFETIESLNNLNYLKKKKNILARNNQHFYISVFYNVVRNKMKTMKTIKLMNNSSNHHGKMQNN